MVAMNQPITGHEPPKTNQENEKTNHHLPQGSDIKSTKTRKWSAGLLWYCIFDSFCVV